MNNYFSPEETTENLVTIGEKKINYPILKSIILGILAGVYIGFGAYIATVVSIGTAEHLGFGLTKLVMGAVFSVGLMLVMIAGAELFTGNNLIIKAVLKKKVTWSQLFKNLGIIYVANFLGAILLVLLIYGSGLWQSANMEIGVKAIEIANAKVNLEFSEALIRGILCNWLVCLAILMALSAKDIVGKIFAIFFPITIFVASGFEHCVANMFFIPMGIILKNNAGLQVETMSDLGNLTRGSFLYLNLLPVTIGNMIGGIVFVGLVYGLIFLKNTK